MFSKELDKKLDEYHLLKHPFYKSWNEGKLTREIIKDYAEQYYQHVKAFPRYISAAHSLCEDIEKRKILLENLQDEDNREHNVDKAKIKSFLEKYPNAHSVDAFGGWDEITFTTSNGKEWNVGKNNRKDFKRLFPDAYSINEYDGYNPQALSLIHI